MRLFSLFILSFSTLAFASLMPRTQPAPQLGFSISANGTNWEEQPTPPEGGNIRILFRKKMAASKQQPTFTVRIEELGSGEKDIKDYFKRWVREYPKFGYSVIGSKIYSLDGQPGYVIDVSSTTSSKQARQVLGEHSKKIVLLTCLGEKKDFTQTVNDCNALIKNFRWASSLK